MATALGVDPWSYTGRDLGIMISSRMPQEKTYPIDVLKLMLPKAN